MATENALERRTIEAAADLSTKQYYFMQIDSNGQMNVASSGSNAVGVLQDKPDAAGRAGSLGYGGTTKVLCGGTIAKGSRVGVNSSGKAVSQASGDYQSMGIALDAGVDGRIISMLFDKRGL